MENVFIVYNSASAAGAAAAYQLKKVLGDGAATDSAGGTVRNDRLLRSDFLVCVFTQESDFECKEISESWRFFLNEIAWKRKKNGQILLFTDEQLGFTRLNYKLKNCPYFTFSETEELVSFIAAAKTAGEQREIVSLTGEAVNAPKQIVYTPRSPAVKQIEFSMRVPEVPSFDGSIRRDGERNADVCRDNHVFEKPFERQEWEIPSRENTKPASTKPAIGVRGCLPWIVLAALLLFGGLTYAMYTL